ncbi:FG-GAP repeat protein [Streptomyces clavuligerus]|uniref:FG-GAP repeat protein n=1 Tax=Streptomyces clavuligerus TaxID=1901 RepID=UPI00017FFCBC|nr:FG-GAP repeat protein [Streptomyces clavuligerus]EDY49687.1 conserved hypothetical protein [Streptomyces clavuligerus]MBY6307406.1 FG-GAP repeat protein [Streptomyces clavuligerus]QCS10034.1 hypothetical protein CRV15_31115 [Streptomyces clavuligerus]QPJ97921.1 hypothetical protein GE265_33330 [Streptomyces clavuligerus]WDN56740.1 FG-GAP repeat protein [Streptomyces clavuligerus]
MRLPAVAAAVLPAVVLSVSVTPTATAAPVPYRGANTAAVQDDFNGDGYRDLAVGAPGADNGTVSGAGAVVVLYGAASSVEPGRRLVITQATAGIPGGPERDDGFGQFVASADVDRDGYADLLVGAPSEDVRPGDSRGSLTVVWGGPKGLKDGANIAPPPGFGDGLTHCRFGEGMATGDMNGDGAPEVSVSTACEGVSYTGPFTRSGKAREGELMTRLGTMRGVAMGDVNRDGRADRFWLPGPTGGDMRGPVLLDAIDPLTGMAARLPHADGHTGRIGDVNGDGYGDLVTGIAQDSSLDGPGAARRGGEIQVLYGGPRGITPQQRPTVLHQDTPGVPGTAADADLFGAALSVGHLDGDAYADVAVGAPNERVGGQDGAGAVTVLRGSAKGLTTAKAAVYTQNTTGVPGGAEGYDEFGVTVHLADLTKDKRAELVVGVPGENEDGCVWAARGTSVGPAVNGSAGICGSRVGLTLSQEGRFGAALTSARSIG